MATIVRRDIWNLDDEGGPWNPVVRAYADAVGVMKQRSVVDRDDPTGWDYQASVHAMASGTPDTFQHECQHASWFFLPWHRIYLHWFEEIVRDIVRTQLPGVPQAVQDAWALPYWDYSRGTPTDRWRRLPRAFRTPTKDDGSPNALFTSRRNTRLNLNMNAGDPLTDLMVSARVALDQLVFSPAPLPGLPGGFGGPVTGWHHDPGPGGALEGTPHGSIHNNVGGPGGLLAGFAGAPLDPVFWLHHANIDRLWTVWLNQDDAPRRNPTESGWLDFPFQFRDATGTPVNPPWSARSVLDTVADLGYTYEVVDRFPADGDALPRSVAPPPTEPAQPDHPPELVGATAAPVVLAGPRRSVVIDVGDAAGPAARGGPGDPDQRVYLQLDDVRGSENPGVTYAVYLNLPDGADPDEDPDTHLVGTLSPFGIEATNDLSRDVHGHLGLSFAFDITGVARTQQDAGRWDPSQVTVTFDVVGGVEPGEVLPAISVGRVGVYYR